MKLRFVAHNFPFGAWTPLASWPGGKRHQTTAASATLRFAIIAVCCFLTGCFGFLKPARSTARHFVLTPMAATNPATSSIGSLALGMGPVKIPAYLFDTSLAVRKGTNEVSYLPSVLWAERLDVGLQRVLAANFASLLPSDQVHLSAWRSEDVSAEVYVRIQEFDVDTAGRCVLVAWWRILAPGGEKTLKTGQSRLTRQGSSPETDPAGAIVALSELVADFSVQLAQAIKELSLTRSGTAAR